MFKFDVRHWLLCHVYLDKHVISIEILEVFLSILNEYI